MRTPAVKCVGVARPKDPSHAVDTHLKAAAHYHAAFFAIMRQRYPPGIGTGLVASLMELDLEGGALVIAEQNQALIEGKLDRIVRIHGGEVVSIEPGGVATDAVADAAGPDGSREE